MVRAAVSFNSVVNGKDEPHGDPDWLTFIILYHMIVTESSGMVN